MQSLKNNHKHVFQKDYSSLFHQLNSMLSFFACLQKFNQTEKSCEQQAKSNK